MKPKIFIGSSTENLDLANALQQNLEYDADTTVWTQGIFKLSSTALDDLISALDKFDFAIFVFKPDDIILMRGERRSSVRDNVIFELGLFIGRLGKRKVFFLAPRSDLNLHLPTDLSGYTFGTYDDQRTDNLNASIGSFCTEIRKELKSFRYLSLTDFGGETLVAKQIAIDRPSEWEFKLAIELLESKMVNIRNNRDDIYADNIVINKKILNREEFTDFVRTSLSTIIDMAEKFHKFLGMLTKAFGEKGVAGNPLEIKNAVDRLIQLCKEILIWQHEVNTLVLPPNLEAAKEIMREWRGVFIDELSSLPKKIQLHLNKYYEDGSNTESINLKLDVPSVEEIGDIITKSYREY